MSAAGGCLWGNGALYSMDIVEFQGESNTCRCLLGSFKEFVVLLSYA